jgi:hypothetical protein
MTASIEQLRQVLKDSGFTQPAFFFWNKKKEVNPQSKNMFDIIDQHHFIGENGKPITGEGLKAQLDKQGLGNKPIIMSFFYIGCGASDPEVLTIQNELAKRTNDGIVHIVVNTKPVLDSLPLSLESGAFRNNLTGKDNWPYPKGTKYLNDNKNLITLYPAADAKGAPFASHDDSYQAIDKFRNQIGTGAAFEPNPGTIALHIPTLMLYKPDGTKERGRLADRIDEKHMGEWTQIIMRLNQSSSEVPQQERRHAGRSY